MSTASDLVRWQRGLVTGKVVSPASYALMIRSDELPNGENPNYGYGLMIGEFDGLPNGAHFFLDLALECLAPLGLELPESARAALDGVKGSSKAAKIARQLKALEGSPVASPPPQVAHEALQARLEFAQALQ